MYGDEVEAEAGTPKADESAGPWRAPWLGPAITAGSAAVVGLASFLPWLQTGHITRNSFQMMRTAELLDVVTGIAVAALRAWYLVPALIALVWLTAALEWPRAMAALAFALVVAAGAAAVVVLRSGVPTGPGPRLALVASTGTLAGSAITVRSTRRPT
jgi:hypothetical protein